MSNNTDQMEPPAPSPVPSQHPEKPRRRDPKNVLLLAIIGLLVIGCASGIIYYAGVYHPEQVRVAATSTAIAQATGTMLAEQNVGATVYAQATAQVAATATANQNIYNQATSGTPTLTDSLSATDSARWYESTNSDGSCGFKGGAYHVSVQAPYFIQCLAVATNYSDFAFQVQMTIIKGTYAGLVLRAPTDRQNAGAYEVILGIDGSYSVTKIVDDAHATSQSFIAGGSDIIHGGLNQANIVTVVVRGSAFYVYVNKQFITSANDSSYTSGSIGFMVKSNIYNKGDTEAVFSNLQVWKL